MVLTGTDHGRMKMYPKFIEVHLADDDCLVSINIDNIISISNTDNHGAGYVIKTSDRGGWYVRESYDELKQLIEDAGCLIHKADPRLDDKPMDWDDFAWQQKGEIFWNDNTRDWFKFDGIVELKDGTKWLGFLGFDGLLYEVYPDDLKAKPMYRMKVA